MSNANKKNYQIMNILWTFGLTLAVPLIFIKLFRIFGAKISSTALAGKVVLITGASSGLGEALAHYFYERGCHLVLCARRMNELERVKADLLKCYPSVQAPPPVLHYIDLNDIDTISEHVDKILSIVGHVDVLINNGGVSHRGTVLATSFDVDMKIMLVNYFGAVALTKALLPSMVQRKSGHIVAISSVQGLVALPERSAYSASKHALQAFCDSLRAEVAKHNVHVTVISPGYIQTNMSINALTGSGSKYGQMDKTTDQGYKPRYVAELIFNAVVTKQKEVVISTFLPKVAIFLRKYFPSVYFYAMTKKAK